jgi:hypothetical protein
MRIHNPKGTYVQYLPYQHQYLPDDLLVAVVLVIEENCDVVAELEGILQVREELLFRLPRDKVSLALVK